MTDEARDTLGQDPQKGKKPSATPPGVNRIDMAEQGPEMSQTSGGNVGIEHKDSDNLGDPAEAGPSAKPPVPSPEDRHGRSA